MIKYGTIGTSWITEEFIAGANLVEGLTLAAVYSRSAQKGESFASHFGANHVYTDLEEMATSDIDAVYIASPNNLHFEQSKLFLSNGKNVICEKPATVTPEQLIELQSLAKSRELIYMEAIMFMHTPTKNILEDALKKVGKISGVHFDFSQLSSRYELFKNGKNPNIFNPKMSGGVLMDLACYCVYPTVCFFGKPKNIFASASFLSNGVDGSGAAIFEYSDMQVVLTYSKIGQDKTGSQIIGDEGTITIGSISKLTDLYLYSNCDGSKVSLAGDTPKPVIMSYEAQAFKNFITMPELYKTEYEKAQKTALEVSRIINKIRRLSSAHTQ